MVPGLCRRSASLGFNGRRFVVLIRSPELPAFYEWLASQSVIGIDTETNGLDPYGQEKRRICGVSMAANDGSAVYLSFRHGGEDNLPTERLQELGAYLTKRTAEGSEHPLRLIFWNAKFDLHMLAVDGYEPPIHGSIEDAMLGAHLLNENEPSFALKTYCDKYGIGRGSLDENALRGVIEQKFNITTKATEWKGLIHKLPADIVTPYAETDAILTLLVANHLEPALAAWRLSDLYTEVNDYMLLLWRMERRGVRLDITGIRNQMKELSPKVHEVSNEILAAVSAETGNFMDPTPRPILYGKRGQPLKQKAPQLFNPGSPTQVAALTGWEKTDVPFIESLDDEDRWKAFGELILDYRVISKMKGTYYDSYLELVDADATLRPNYNIHGTVSGRLSCSRPNLQNVPRYTERRPVKGSFVPRPGYLFMEMDYSQAELRIASHYANETRMRAIFESGGDPHGETAAKLGIPRFVAKTLNFLIIYGGGVRAIVKTLGCSEEVGRAYIDGYHGLYPGFRKLSNTCSAQAGSKGYIRMETGRLARFNTWKRYRSESDPRKAMNRLIQGSSAEMLRIGMQRVDDSIREQGLDAFPLLQVHDSLLLEVTEKDIPALAGILRSDLRDFNFSPRPEIDLKIGSSWAPMKEYV